MLRYCNVRNLRSASTLTRAPLPNTVKAFFGKPGHEVSTFLNKLSETELNTRIGPTEVDDILVYYKLIQDTDHQNLTLADIMRFENKMLGVTLNQLENPMIMNDTFDKFLKRKQYFKYLLLLKRLPFTKEKIVYVNKLLSHYIKDLHDYDSAIYLFKKLLKDKWSPSEHTYSTMFMLKANENKEQRYLYFKYNSKETFYRNLIKDLTDAIAYRKPHKLTSHVRSFEEVVINAFRFSSRNLSFGNTAMLMDKLVTNAPRFIPSKYVDTFINTLYMILWRSLSEALYEVDHEFSPRAKTVIKECLEKNMKMYDLGDDLTDVDIEEDTYIDETTGKLEYSFNGRAIKKELTTDEKYKVQIQRLYKESLNVVVNDDDFFEYTSTILKSQANINQYSLIQIMSTLKNKMFSKLTQPETKKEIMHTLYFIFADCFAPLNDKVNYELKAIKDKILRETPDFKECRTMKIFYNKLNGLNKKFFWNASAIEQFNVLLTSSPDNLSLYMSMKDHILTKEFLERNQGKNFVFSKWLSDLSYFNEGNPGLANNLRMKYLEEDFMDLIVTDVTSLLSTYDFYLKTWFVYGYKSGLQSEAAVYKNMAKLAEIFIEKKNKLGIKDESLEKTILDKYHDAFTKLKKSHSGISKNKKKKKI